MLQLNFITKYKPSHLKLSIQDHKVLQINLQASFHGLNINQPISSNNKCNNIIQ